MDDVDEAIVKLQTLIDKVKTASYGYAGLFDPVRIKEAELDALNRFDVAMAQEVGAINTAIVNLANSIADKANIAPAIDRVTGTVAELTRLFDKRKEAVVSPDLLNNADYAPPMADIAAPPAADVAPPQASDVLNDPNAVG